MKQLVDRLDPVRLLEPGGPEKQLLEKGLVRGLIEVAEGEQEPLFRLGKVPVHVGRLALEVRFPPLERRLVNRKRKPDQVNRAAQIVQDRLIIEGRPHLIIDRSYIVQDRPVLGLPLLIRFDEALECFLFLAPALDQPEPFHPLELPAEILHRVRQPFDTRRMEERHTAVLRSHLLHEADLPGIPVGDIGHPDFFLESQVAGRAVPEGSPGIAQEEDEIALTDTPGRDPQKTLGSEGDVFGRVIGRRPVRSDIGPQEGKVSGVARPHPVVFLAAELADRAGRDISQADIFQIRVNKQDIGFSGEHFGHFGPFAGFLFFRASHDLLGPPLDGLGAGRIVHLRLHSAQHLRRDILEGLGDAGRHPFGLDLLGPCPGQEAVADVIVLLGARGLDGPEGNVVVRYEQTLGRNE